MATIKYNGMELEEFTSDEPVIFYPSKRSLVWDCAGGERLCNVTSYDPRLSLPVIIETGVQFNHMAILPDPPKPRRATNRELARWLAQGNGEVKYASQYAVKIKIEYGTKCDNDPCHESFKVRKWSDTEWHEPTVDYLDIDDKDYNFNKKYGEV